MTSQELLDKVNSVINNTQAGYDPDGIRKVKEWTGYVVFKFSNDFLSIEEDEKVGFLLSLEQEHRRIKNALEALIKNKDTEFYEKYKLLFTD